MKQSSGELLTLAMGRLLAARLATRLPETPDYLASVPPHWSRRLSRAISCPEILREMLCRQLGLRSAAGLLKCRRKTKKQGTLLPAERRRNVRGAYAVSAGYAIKGASILVVDDVMTTGATANEIAKVLRRAGAKRVTIAAVARGIGFDG
jgi:predicted amidophosphoribosyltransferase